MKPRTLSLAAGVALAAALTACSPSTSADHPSHSETSTGCVGFACTSNGTGGNAPAPLPSDTDTGGVGGYTGAQTCNPFVSGCTATATGGNTGPVAR